METNRRDGVVDYQTVSLHLWAFVLYGFVVILAGLSYSMQFLQKYPFPGIEWLSPGRIRMVHTQAVAYAMLANGLFASVYYMVPKLTGFRVWSETLARFLFWSYNTLVLLTVGMIMAGFAQDSSGPRRPSFLIP